MTMIDIDAAMTVAEPVNANQRSDWGRWMQGTEIGGLIDAPQNPVLFQR